MPRIRCRYIDCKNIESGFCGADQVDLDPELGCLTYAPEDEELLKEEPVVDEEADEEEGYDEDEWDEEELEDEDFFDEDEDEDEDEDW